MFSKRPADKMLLKIHIDLDDIIKTCYSSSLSSISSKIKNNPLLLFISVFAIYNIDNIKFQS